MEPDFHAQEATLYRMLRQVLENHITLHERCLDVVYVALAQVLGAVCRLGCDAGMAPLPVLLGDVCRWLKVRIREAPAVPLLPLVGEPHDTDATTDRAASDAQMVALCDAVVQLINDASQEAQLRWEVLLNVMLGLLTDVFHALLERGTWEPEEVDTFLGGVFQDDLRRFIERDLRADVQARRHTRP